MDRVGLVAGSGSFPLTFAMEARKKGVTVIAFAIKDVTSPELEKYANKVHWIDVAKFSIPGFIFTLMTERIKKMVMVGKIDKSEVFKNISNKGIAEVINNTKDNKDYSILDDVTKRFSQIGIQVVGVLEYLHDIVPQKGILTKRLPSEKEKADIEFGVEFAREMARLDIGQTITVKNKSVVTVEAMEGTDATIRRAKEVVDGDFVVIKVARPKQDMRWDVPLIGFDTVRTVIESGGTVLAIESGKMFFTERDKCIREADAHNITILAV